jgi:hypothetical protein
MSWKYFLANKLNLKINCKIFYDKQINIKKYFLKNIFLIQTQKNLENLYFDEQRWKVGRIL